jgi:anti-sigma factor RsiW
MQRMKRPESCISDLTFDRAAAGELSDNARQTLEQRLSDCVRCSLHYEMLNRQRAAFLGKANDWDSFTQRTAAPAPAPPWRRRVAPTLYTVVGLAAAALLAVIVGREGPAALDRHQGSAAHERTKGGASIGFFVRRAAHVTRGASGDEVFPSDELRFTYSSERTLQFALLYADTHAATVYYPLTEHTAQIEPGHDVPLDFGIALDEQPGSERAFGLFCEQAQLLEPLRAQLQVTGALPAPEGCFVDVLILQKRPR